MEKKAFAMAAIAVILLLAVAVFLFVGPTTWTTPAVSGTEELLLDGQDLQELGLTGAKSFDGADCLTEEQTSFSMSRVQYSVCNYTIDALNDTWVVVEFKKFASLGDLNDTYQYESSHLFSVEGLISENDFGDQSRFRVNDVNDYGGQYNEPGVYYYHLWVCKDEYLIHVTSKGRSEEAGEHVAEIGRRILSKFG